MYWTLSKLLFWWSTHLWNRNCLILQNCGNFIEFVRFLVNDASLLPWFVLGKLVIESVCNNSHFKWTVLSWLHCYIDILSINYEVYIESSSVPLISSSSTIFPFNSKTKSMFTSFSMLLGPRPHFTFIKLFYIDLERIHTLIYNKSHSVPLISKINTFRYFFSSTHSRNEISTPKLPKNNY